MRSSATRLLDLQDGDSAQPERLLHSGVVVFALWVVVFAATALLLLHDGAGAVANTVSILVGRPIALTARSRESVNLSGIDPQTRRQFRVALLTMAVLVVLGLTLAIVSG